ncbi:MAG: hypothetical protein IK020_00375 [Clostridiales bacterium]|nr:hypothetical protein [Clostridiales bacterium]
MKLTNLNCPQCNGLLNQERDMFFCSSCGSAFAVDYDENDVRYTQLVTEADRTKMLLAKDVNLMQTDYALREQVLQNEQDRETARQRKTAVKTAFTGMRVAIIGLILSVVQMLAIFGYLFYVLRNVDAKVEERNAIKNQTLYDYLKEDQHLLENTIASGRAYIYSSRYAMTEDDRYVEPRMAYYNDDATIDSVYVLKTQGYSRPGILCIYSLSYTYVDTGEVIELYDYVLFREMDVDSDGLLQANYTPDTRLGGDYIWHAYYDKDQLLREQVRMTSKTYEANEVEIPDEWKEAKA